jgi:hypothetical protein
MCEGSREAFRHSLHTAHEKKLEVCQLKFPPPLDSILVYMNDANQQILWYNTKYM